MSFSKRRWAGSGLEEDDPRVSYSVNSDQEATCTIELQKRSQEGEDEDKSDGERSDQEASDRKTLLTSEEGVDSEGAVREYEVALKYLGFGPFHILLLFVSGIALLSDSIEILSISFVLPVLSDPQEFGVSDADGAILGSSIFVGMLFGSYIWGGLADVIGRRATIVCSLTLSAIFGFLSAFSPWFWLFVLFRLCSGFG